MSLKYTKGVHHWMTRLFFCREPERDTGMMGKEPEEV